MKAFIVLEVTPEDKTIVAVCSSHLIAKNYIENLKNKHHYTSTESLEIEEWKINDEA